MNQVYEKLTAFSNMPANFKMYTKPLLHNVKVYCYKFRYPFHLKFLCCLFLFRKSIQTKYAKFPIQNTYGYLCLVHTSYIWISYTMIFKAQFSKLLTIAFKHSTSYYELLVKKGKVPYSI